MSLSDKKIDTHLPVLTHTSTPTPNGSEFIEIVHNGVKKAVTLTELKLILAALP